MMQIGDRVAIGGAEQLKEKLAHGACIVRVSFAFASQGRLPVRVTYARTTYDMEMRSPTLRQALVAGDAIGERLELLSYGAEFLVRRPDACVTTEKALPCFEIEYGS